MISQTGGNVILGGLVGLVIGCFIALLSVWMWRSVGPLTDPFIRITVYVGTPIGIIICIVIFAFLGLHNGW